MQYISRLEASLKQINFAFSEMNFDVTLKYGVSMCKKDDTVGTLMQRVNKALTKAKKSRMADIKYLL